MQVIVEHVRSFSGRRRIGLKPLTLLVGENSSGKSTFLSVLSSICDAKRFPLSPGFNEPPYSLGTFDTIATYRGGKYGRDETFSVGFATGDAGEGESREVIATYASEYGNTVLRSVRAIGRPGSLELDISDGTVTGRFTIDRTDEADAIGPFEFRAQLPEMVRGGQSPFQDILLSAIFAEYGPGRKKSSDAGNEWLKRTYRFLTGLGPPYHDCYSFAPIRSKPRRTYDEFSDDYSPEGDHIPTLLARLLGQKAQTPEGRRLRSALQNFGEESGLFKTVDVKKLGKKVSDPFQIRVSVAGPAANLVDVGYGVSQALPIVVQSVLKSTSKMLLMQQPEVHLHPRAQAALGSFFAELVAQQDRTVVLESHSDYLVDRVRQEVARGRLRADQVLILFFHKPKLETFVHEITLDGAGNVENAPPHYREFFLQEELNLFNRAGT